MYFKFQAFLFYFPFSILVFTLGRRTDLGRVVEGWSSLLVLLPSGQICILHGFEMNGRFVCLLNDSQN